jgi:carbamoyl-phosphate synthase large subunit
MSGRELRVAVAGFAGLDDPQSGASATRALRAGWAGRLEIHALGHDAVMTGAWMPDTADHIHILPPHAEDSEALLDRIFEIHKSRRLDALLVCHEADLPVLARHADELTRRGIRTLLPKPERLAELLGTAWPGTLRALGFDTPPTLQVTDLQELEVQGELLGYPLLIRHDALGSKVVQNAEEAKAVACALSTQGGAALLQRSIGGEGFAVSLVADRDSACCGMVSLRKLAVNADDRLVCGSAIDDPGVAKLALEIVEALEWRGPLELEFVRTAGRKSVLCSGLRCALPSWSMMTHWAGCNLPVVCLEEALERGSGRTAKASPGTIFLQGIAESAVPLNEVMSLQQHGSVNGGAASRGAVPAGPSPASQPSPGELRVAVTGIGSFDAINPGIGVARCLRQSARVSEIHGLGYGTLDSGAYQPGLLDTAHRLPVSEDPEVLFRCLAEAHRSQPFDVILPCLDTELPRFIEIEEQLADHLGVATLLPSRQALERRSKLGLFDGRRRNRPLGFEIPDSRIVESERELLKSLRAFGYPLVVKGPIFGCMTVKSESDARAAWQRFKNQEDGKVIVQAMIHGDSFALAALCDRTHELRTAITVKKLALCGRGSTWSALQVDEPELIESFAAFLRDIEWTGPVEGEFIRDTLSERFYLFEVNPRFTGWISFTAALGRNQPELAARLAVGEQAAPEEALRADANNLVFMRSCEEVRVRPVALAALSNGGFVRHDRP